MTTRTIIPADVIALVLREYGVSFEDFAGTQRAPHFVRAREACAWLCREVTTQSYPEIAREMGRPTHTTVVAMVKRVWLVYSIGAEITEKLDRMTRELKGTL